MKIIKKDSESKHKCRNLSEEQKNKKREYEKIHTIFLKKRSKTKRISKKLP